MYCPNRDELKVFHSVLNDMRNLIDHLLYTSGDCFSSMHGVTPYFFEISKSLICDSNTFKKLRDSIFNKCFDLRNIDKGGDIENT